jgi:hypothetical protein
MPAARLRSSRLRPPSVLLSPRHPGRQPGRRTNTCHQSLTLHCAQCIASHHRGLPIYAYDTHLCLSRLCENWSSVRGAICFLYCSPPTQSPVWLPGCPEELAWGMPIQLSFCEISNSWILFVLNSHQLTSPPAPQVTKMPHQVAMGGMPSLFLWSILPRPHSYAFGFVRSLDAPLEVTRRHTK